jgi:rhamnosyltransferase
MPVRRSPRGKSPRCSLVIRAFNEERHIGRLLVGVQNQTVRPVEVILVDSGSTDATLAIASQYAVRILHIKPASFSFGRSLNLGCDAARGEFVVIASAHVYPVYPDWLESLLDPFVDERVAAVYGKQRGNAATRFSEHQVFRQWFPEGSRPRQEGAFCNNANAAIRRPLWLQRKYREDLPALEDVEWATWALDQGYFVSYRAEAEVVHVHEEEPAAVFNRYRREAMALKQIRPQEQFGLVDFLRLFLGHILADVRQAIRQRVLRRKLGEILWFRWMQLGGTLRGFSTSGPLTGKLKEAFYYPRRSTASASDGRRAVLPLDYTELGHATEEAPSIRKAREGTRR